MLDHFATNARGPQDPAITLLDIEPNDTIDLLHITTSLNVATPGTVRVTMEDGTIGSIFVAAGLAFPIRVSRVWLTGTTATGIRGLT